MKNSLIMGEVEVICSTWLILKMIPVQMVPLSLSHYWLYFHFRYYVYWLCRCRSLFHYTAWDYSSWVRTYALFLEERLECFRVLKYDIEADRPVSNFSFYFHKLTNLTIQIFHFEMSSWINCVLFINGYYSVIIWW